MNKLFLYITLLAIAFLASCSSDAISDEISAPSVDIESTEQEDQVIVDFTIDNKNNTVMEGEPILITNSSENAVSYHWDFGNGDTATEAIPTYTYDYHGYFAVKLTVTDKSGNETQLSHNLEVLCPFAGQDHSGSN